MTGKIKIHWFDVSRNETREVDLEEAQRIVTESYTHGNTAIDKKTGAVVEVVKPEIDEIVIVGAIDGG